MKYYQPAGIDYTSANGIPWGVCQRMVVPAGPVSLDSSISSHLERLLLARPKKAVLVRRTDGFHPGILDSPWYAVTCHNFLNMDRRRSELRHHIRAGLRRCTYARLAQDFLRIMGGASEKGSH